MRAVLLFALALGGCSFIDDFGKFSVGGATDGGSHDAGPRLDGSPLDAGGGACSAPCVGDIVADYSNTQPSGTLGWEYLADDRDPAGVAYAPMVAGSFDDIAGWIGPEGSPPAIVSCVASASAACAGITDRVLAVPSDPSAGTADAVFSYTATRNETMQLSMTARMPDGASGDELVQLFVSRNSRHDVVFASSFLPTTAPRDFGGAIDLLEGDRLFFEIRTAPDGASPGAPIGLAGRVSRLLEGPGANLENCLFAATFDGAEPLQDPCGDAALSDANDGLTPGMTSVIPSAAAWLGNARMFPGGGYIASSGSPVDYSGDFTIQFWMQYPEPGDFAMTAFSDRTVEAPGGIIISPEEMEGGAGPMFVGTIYRDPTGVCDDGMGFCYAYFRANRPTDSQWHFYRVVRSTASNRMSLCIDGREVGGTSVPGDIDLTSTYPPHIGRNVVFNPAEFIGALDDVRIFKTALPCEL
jgi:hypothetical protein